MFNKKAFIFSLFVLLIYSYTPLLFAESIRLRSGLSPEFNRRTESQLEEEVVVLQELVNEALMNNPQIQAAYNNWQAAEEKIKQVSSLPDPMASYTYFGESVETKVGPQEAKYGLSQKIPFPGKLSLKAKAQSKHADMLR
jgi:outer membrane protein TolC